MSIVLIRSWHYVRRQRWDMCLFLALLMLFSCYHQESTPAPIQAGPVWLAQAASPDFVDDLDQDSLQQALQRSLAYLRRLPAARTFPFGDRQVTTAVLLESLVTFQQLLVEAPTPEALQVALAEQFEVVQAAGRKARGDVLFTGYYEMVLEGSLTPTPAFPYPLYARPPDLLHVDLGAFDPRYNGERLIARAQEGQVLPYYTRHEIDDEGKLYGRNLEIFWLRDAVERFFLHIQGSGQIVLPDGQIQRVNYAASNGHSYRSIGRLLIEEGKVPRQGMSMQSLRRYFLDKPAERARVLRHNPRYIFFRQVSEGPVGALGFVLIPERSVAMDLRLFPSAALAFIQTQQPVLDATGKVTGWRPLSRFVLNHDTGGAIKGPGRVDIFWGSGQRAGAAAGHMKHEGKLFFLLKRQASDEIATGRREE